MSVVKGQQVSIVGAYDATADWAVVVATDGSAKGFVPSAYLRLVPAEEKVQPAKPAAQEVAPIPPAAAPVLSLGFIAGKSITSLILLEFVKSIVILSTPIPHPAVGGRPYSKAVTKLWSTC